MKKWIFILIIFLGGPFLRASNNKVDDLFRQLDKYEPNAIWIIEECMAIQLDDFNVCWAKIVSLLTQKENRRSYFMCTDYNEEYWIKALWQCLFYDWWLKHLFVEVKTGTLFFSKNRSLQEGTISIFNYWKKNSLSQSYLPYHQFYAFYMDGLSYFFYDIVNEAYELRTISNAYKEKIIIARKCVNKMNHFLKYLEKTPFYEDYFFTINKYQEILRLIQQGSRINEN